jgi:peptidoglycan biosynthesis protein MviN/MurJ (putative lipid II flippase)
VIQTVILPLFVRHHNRNEPHLREKMYSLSLHLGFVFGVSIALAVSLAAEPIAALCFGHGKMSAENVSEIASLLRLGVWSTPFAVLSCLWQQMLYAGHRAKSAMMVSLIVTASLLPLYWLGLTMQGAYGVMIAYLVIRMLHLAVIVKLGKPGAVSAALLPGREYPLSAGAMLGVFAVLAWLYKACLPGFSDNAKVLAAMVIGGAVLAAGLWAHKEIRHMLRFKTVEFEV